MDDLWTLLGHAQAHVAAYKADVQPCARTISRYLKAYPGVVAGVSVMPPYWHRTVIRHVSLLRLCEQVVELEQALATGDAVQEVAARVQETLRIVGENPQGRRGRRPKFQSLAA